MVLSFALLTIFGLACVIYLQRRELSNLEEKQAKKKKDLLKYSGGDFPILHIALKKAPIFEIQSMLKKHRDRTTVDAIRRVLTVFVANPSQEMVDFHIAKNLEMPARAPEVIHVLYQSSKPANNIADWENLSENLKLQLRLINKLVNQLRQI